MRAVVPDELIEERRRLGLDRRDEMWDGVLHMVPPASSAHNKIGADFAGVLGRLVAPGDDGWTSLHSLDVAIRLSDGVLQIRTAAGIEEV